MGSDYARAYFNPVTTYASDKTGLKMYAYVFFPEGFPWLHFPGPEIDPIDLRGFRTLPGNGIHRCTVLRPANDQVVRVEPRYRMKIATFERPNPKVFHYIIELNDRFYHLMDIFSKQYFVL